MAQEGTQANVQQSIQGYQLLTEHPGTWPGVGYTGQLGSTQVHLHHLSLQRDALWTYAQWQALTQRIHKLLELQHPGLCPYTQCLEASDHELWLVSPLASAAQPHLPGDLRALLASQSPGRLNETNALDAFQNLYEGLNYLHQQELFHGAIAPSTVWLNWQKRPLQVQLALPGLCVPATTPLPLDRQPYLPLPSTVQPHNDELAAGIQQDRFGLGALLWLMVTGAAPPSSPPYTTELSTPWPWELSRPVRAPRLLSVWRELLLPPPALSQEMTAQTRSQRAGLSDTLPFAPDLTAPSPHKVQTPWSVKDITTLPYHNELQEALATLQSQQSHTSQDATSSTALDATSSTALDIPPTSEAQAQPDLAHNISFDVPDAIPELWEREAINRDALLEQQKRATQQWKTWTLLFLLLFVAWLWKLTCAT